VAEEAEGEAIEPEGPAASELRGESSEEEGMDEVGRGMTAEQVDQLVSMRLRQLDREYNETAGVAAVGAGNLPEETDVKMRKLAELRARLAAAKAAAAATATMELAPGADEFPEDYDELQLNDSKALVESKEPGPVLALTAEDVKLVAPSMADFDPFGTDALQKQLARLPRAISPLGEETRSTIAQAMSRIKIVPKGPVGPWAERVVSAALAQTQNRGNALVRLPSHEVHTLRPMGSYLKGSII
jgi:hypothetical protein